MKKKLATFLTLTFVMAQGSMVQAAPVQVPTEVEQVSIEVGEMYDFCPELIQIMCFIESSFNPRAENGGCIGVMQVNPAWHKERMERLGVTDLFDIRENILVGVDYLAELERQYEDIGIVLMVYNGDSDAESAMQGIAEISDYTNEILTLSAELERANGK